MNKIIYTLVFFTIIATSCNRNKTISSESSVELNADKSVSVIEAAHNKSVFLDKGAVQFDLRLSFGGRERINGTLTLSTNSRNGLIELNNGNKIYYRDDQVMYSPEIEKTKGARFDAYTWSYFFLLPYKLSDPGTHWSSSAYNQLNGRIYDAHKLSFDEGVGDAPDDWYIVYSDKNSHLIESAAYIVTANKSVEKAEEDPHAIRYSGYQEVDGVPIATQWSFWGWTKAENLTKQLGEATLTRIKFVDVAADYFSAPDHYLRG